MTGDGVPVVLVTMAPGNHSTPVEILQWTGRAFKEIGETSDGATFVDLDHDGVPEIVTEGCCETNECDAVVHPPYLQKVQSGEFGSVTRPTLAAVFVVTKESGKRETFTEMPYLADSFSLKCHLRIVNGTRNGGHRATALALHTRSLLPTRASNGEEAEPPPGKRVKVSLTASDEAVEIPLVLPSRCALLDVMLSGPAGATVVLIIDTLAVEHSGN